MDYQGKPAVSFTINYYQFMDKDGNLTQELPDFATPEHLIKSYETMVLVRIFDAKAIALQRTGQLGTYPSALGQEAIGVAIGLAMKPEDVFCPYYREFGAMLLRGVKMEEIYLFWGGDERGNAFANSHDFPHSVPIGSQTLYAAGVAAAFKIRHEPRCALSAVGDGGTSEGDFYEALNVAGAWHLPEVFVINNNKWAISVPLYKQTAAQTLAQKALAAGIECAQVDGNDVIALEALIRYGLDRARKGKGPFVIEALTYRLGDHTTADDARRYRSDEELAEARGNDPIKRLRTYLEAQGLWDAQKEDALTKKCQAQVEEAVANYLATPPQPISAIFDYQYAQLPAALEEQYNTAIRFAGSNAE
jgi:pyruvate dehydrogenase E1 component alpha subunit